MTITDSRSSLGARPVASTNLPRTINREITSAGSSSKIIDIWRNHRDNFNYVNFVITSICHPIIFIRKFYFFFILFITSSKSGYRRFSRATFNFLDSATQNLVVAEFSEMVDADFIEDTTSNLLGAGWPQRDRLAAALGNTNVIFRKALYNRLAFEGIKLKIPGIEYDERPWR